MHEYVVLRVGFWLRVMQTGILVMTSHWLKEAPWHGTIAGKVCNVTRAPPAAIPELGCSWRQTSRCWWLCCCSCRQRLQMPRLHCCKTGTDDRIWTVKMKRRDAPWLAVPKHCAAWQSCRQQCLLHQCCTICHASPHKSSVKQMALSSIQGPQAQVFQFANINVKSAPAGTSLYETPPSLPGAPFCSTRTLVLQPLEKVS